MEAYSLYRKMSVEEAIQLLKSGRFLTKKEDIFNKVGSNKEKWFSDSISKVLYFNNTGENRTKVITQLKFNRKFKDYLKETAILQKYATQNKTLILMNFEGIKDKIKYANYSVPFHNEKYNKLNSQIIDISFYLQQTNKLLDISSLFKYLYNIFENQLLPDNAKDIFDFYGVSSSKTKNNLFIFLVKSIINRITDDTTTKYNNLKRLDKFYKHILEISNSKLKHQNRNIKKLERHKKKLEENNKKTIECEGELKLLKETCPKENTESSITIYVLYDSTCKVCHIYFSPDYNSKRYDKHKYISRKFEIEYRKFFNFIKDASIVKYDENIFQLFDDWKSYDYDEIIFFNSIYGIGSKDSITVYSPEKLNELNFRILDGSLFLFPIENNRYQHKTLVRTFNNLDKTKNDNFDKMFNQYMFLLENSKSKKHTEKIHNQFHNIMRNEVYTNNELSVFDMCYELLKSNYGLDEVIKNLLQYDLKECKKLNHKPCNKQNNINEISFI